MIAFNRCFDALIQTYLFLLNGGIMLFFGHSRISLICLIFSLPDLCFYTISFIPLTMFLKDLNNVNFRALTQTKLFLIIDVRSFAKLLELLAINYSLSERRTIFVPQLLMFSHVVGFFITCLGSHFSAVELDNVVHFSTFPGCQSSCGIVPKWA